MLNLVIDNFWKLLHQFRCDANKNEIKSFDQIPGPRGPLGLGTLIYYSTFWRYYSFDHLHKTGFKKYNEYGRIVCERIMPGVNIVWIFDPEDIKMLLTDKSGHYPFRRSHLAIQKYRNDKPEVYSSAGLLPT